MSKKVEETYEDLEGFAWDQADSSTEFFGINQLTPNADNPPSEYQEEPKEEPSEEIIDEDDEPIDFGADAGEDTPVDADPEDPTDADDPADTKVGSIYNDVYTDMTNNGVFEHMEIEEGAELTAEDFIELTKAEVEARVEAGINEWADESLDEDAKAFIQFKLKGGNTRDFFSTLEQTPDIPEGDLSNERYQEKLVIEQLRAEGKDDYEIEDQLDFLKSKGRLESYAVKAQKKLEQTKEEYKQRAIEEAERNRQRAIEAENQFKNNIAETLRQEDDYYGLRITPSEKRRIEGLITKRDHKLPSGQMVTGMQKLLGEVAKDPKQLIALTKVIESGFNFEQIIKKAKTEETKKIRSVLENRSISRTESGSSSGRSGSLSDKFL